MFYTHQSLCRNVCGFDALFYSHPRVCFLYIAFCISLKYLKIYICRKKGLNSRIKIFLLSAICFQFIVSTAYWTVGVAELFIKVKGYFVNRSPENVPNIQFISLWNSVALVNVSRTIMSPNLSILNRNTGHQFVFADGVVVWRACALCRQDYGKILIAPIFFLALSLRTSYR